MCADFLVRALSDQVRTAALGQRGFLFLPSGVPGVTLRLQLGQLRGQLLGSFLEAFFVVAVVPFSAAAEVLTIRFRDPATIAVQRRLLSNKQRPIVREIASR